MIPVVLLLFASALVPDGHALVPPALLPQEDGNEWPAPFWTPPIGLATEADVAAAAERAIADVWPDAEVRVVRLSAAAATAHPPLRVRFVDDAPRGRASAEVETRAGEAWTSAGWAYLDVAVYDTAFVLAHDVARGDALADAVRRQRVEVTAISDPLLLPDSGLEGWSAARSLRAGTVLTARLADAPSAVESRAPLRVRYTRGVLSVTLSCEARERGAIGDTIRVTCSDPHASYSVRLTAPGEGVWTRTL